MRNFCRAIFCCTCCCKGNDDFSKDINPKTRLLPHLPEQNNANNPLNDAKIYIYGTVTDYFGNATTDISKIASIIGNSKIIDSLRLSKVVSGEEHALFLFNDGSLLAVGSNAYGQLGETIQMDASLNHFKEFKKLQINLSFDYRLKGASFQIIDIAAGSYFSLVLIKITNGNEANKTYLIKFGIEEKDKYSHDFNSIKTVVRN